MSQSTIFGWPYPNENDDPWFEGFQAFVTAEENTVFGLMSATVGGNIIVGGGVVDFAVSGSQGVFTWTANFEIPLIQTGFFLEVEFGPDHINRKLVMNDGDRVVVTVPQSAGANVAANFAIINGAVETADLMALYTFGMYRGGKFYANIPQQFG